MPGRHEDAVWRCFVKSKPRNKSYAIGACKGCSEEIPGLANRLRVHADACEKLQEMGLWVSDETPKAKKPKVQTVLSFGATNIEDCGQTAVIFFLMQDGPRMSSESCVTCRALKQNWQPVNAALLLIGISLILVWTTGNVRANFHLISMPPTRPVAQPMPQISHPHLQSRRFFTESPATLPRGHFPDMTKGFTLHHWWHADFIVPVSVAVVTGVGFLLVTSWQSRRFRAESPWVMMAVGNEPEEAKKAKAPAKKGASRDPPGGEGVDPFSRLAWQATEWFGNAARLVRGPGAAPSPQPGLGLPKTIEEATERLREDYSKEYFITGKMDLDLYAEDCYFADDFAGFRGRARFKSNLDNLTSFITDWKVQLLSLDREDSAPGQAPVVRSRCLVKLQLGLPWRPVLAWVWGVRHVFDPTTPVIVQHLETWEVTPQEGLRQLFRPGPPRGLQQGRGEP
eukprot:EG_transcript_9391